MPLIGSNDQRNMEISHIAIVIVIAVLFVFVFLAKRLLRLAIRLMLAGIIIIFLLAAVSLGWWQGWFNRPPVEKTPARTAPTRRVSSH